MCASNDLLGRTLVVCLFLVFSMRAATVESIRSLMNAGRTAEALNELQALQQESAGKPDMLFEIGNLFQELAAERAERLEQLAPESPQVQELMGKFLESHNRLPEALSRYRLAAQKDSSLPGIHFLIGNLYWKQRDLNGAAPELQAELRLNSNHSLANLRMGEILLVTDADHPEKALPYLERAASDADASLEAHRELGKALRMTGRNSEALKELKSVAAREPEDSKVHAQLAAVYRAMGNAEAAKKEMEAQRQLLQKQRDAALEAQQERAPR